MHTVRLRHSHSPSCEEVFFRVRANFVVEVFIRRELHSSRLVKLQTNLRDYLRISIKRKRACNLQARICRIWGWNLQQFLLWMTSYNDGRMLELDFESAPYSQAPFTLERLRARTFKAWRIIRASYWCRASYSHLSTRFHFTFELLEPRAQTFGWSRPHGEILEHRTIIL